MDSALCQGARVPGVALYMLLLIMCCNQVHHVQQMLDTSSVTGFTTRDLCSTQVQWVQYMFTCTPKSGCTRVQ